MVFARTGDNDFSTCGIIVSPNLSDGATHTTIASAYADAVSLGVAVIFVKPGTYTENLTMNHGGIDLVSYESYSPDPNGIRSRPIIIGKITATFSGSANITGFQLQTNGGSPGALIQVSGNAQTRLTCNNCLFTISAATGISFTSTGNPAYLRLLNCQASITSSQALFASSGINANSILEITNMLTVSADSTSAASTISAGQLQVYYSDLNFPITTSGTAGILSKFCTIDTSANNSTALTLGGSGTQRISHSRISSGSASAISIGATATIEACSVTSSNTNAITGAGTINYGPIDFLGSSTTINTSTKNAFPSTVEMGGTGASTLTGVLIGNGQSAITGNAVTQHDVLIGGASNAITSVAPSSTSGVALISQGASADPTFGTVVVAGGGTGATTLTGVLVGNGTSAVTASAITQHDVLVGGASNAITSVAPSATSGIPLVSGGASADPSFTTAVVAGGGTGITSATAYAVLTGGTTSTNPFQSIASVGTSGQFLTSNGAGALPTFQGTFGSAFTPVLKFGGGTTGITYSTQIGEYTQIGNIVFIYVNIQLSNKGSSTGAATITGLPVTTNANANVVALTYFSNITLTTNYTNVACYNNASSTLLNVIQSGSGQAAAILADTNFSNTSTLIFNAWYFTT